MKEYKAVIYQEGMLGSLLLGESKINPVRFFRVSQCQRKRGVGSGDYGERYTKNAAFLKEKAM